MADTFTSKLRIRLQQTGANRNTWGQHLNSAALQLIEDAISGVAPITVAGSNLTLTSQNGASDQARNMVLFLQGAPGATREITVPTTTKLYLVINDTGHGQTLKTALGTGVTVPHGARQFIACDGTNVVAVQATTIGSVADAEKLDGLDSTAFAQLALFNTFAKGFNIPFVALTDGSTVTIDATVGCKFYLAIAGNRTLAINGIKDGQELEIWVKQDATGGRTLLWPANVQFETGSSGALSAPADSLDRFKLTYNQTLDKYIARSGVNASASAVNLTLTGSHVNVNVHELAGSPAGGVTINFTLDTGARIYSASPTVPALDFDGLPSGSVVTFTNRGKVMGCGGRGGAGGSIQRIGDDDFGYGGEPGEPGGTAVRGPGAGRTFEIINVSGFIWGGGGGGGGGGVSCDNGGNLANGGGGGGGAGAGRRGAGAQLRVVEGASLAAAAHGSGGTLATTSAGGGGGAGTNTGTATGGNGGAGGDWGTAGTAGDSPTANDQDVAGGAGGAAGLAVDQNGGTATFVSGNGSPNVKGTVA